MASNNAGIPAINSEFVGENRGLTQAWYNYLLSLSPQQAGAAAQVQTLGASPFLFAAPVAGSLVVESNGGTMAVELSRDNGLTFYTIATGATVVPLRRLDQVLISWTVSSPPTVWLPDA